MTWTRRADRGRSLGPEVEEGTSSYEVRVKISTVDPLTEDLVNRDLQLHSVLLTSPLTFNLFPISLIFVFVFVPLPHPLVLRSIFRLHFVGFLFHSISSLVPGVPVVLGLVWSFPVEKSLSVRVISLFHRNCPTTYY